jgi:hypothetical protein
MVNGVAQTGMVLVASVGGVTGGFDGERHGVFVTTGTVVCSRGDYICLQQSLVATGADAYDYFLSLGYHE